MGINYDLKKMKVLTCLIVSYIFLATLTGTVLTKNRDLQTDIQRNIKREYIGNADVLMGIFFMDKRIHFLTKERAMDLFCLYFTGRDARNLTQLMYGYKMVQE